MNPEANSPSITFLTLTPAILFFLLLLGIFILIVSLNHTLQADNFTTTLFTLS